MSTSIVNNLSDSVMPTIIDIDNLSDGAIVNNLSDSVMPTIIDIDNLSDGAIINIPEGTSVEVYGMFKTPVTISKERGMVNLGDTTSSNPRTQCQSGDDLVMRTFQSRTSMYINFFFINKDERGCNIPTGLIRLSEDILSGVSLSEIEIHIRRDKDISKIHKYDDNLCFTDGFIWVRITQEGDIMYMRTYFEAGKPGGSHWNCCKYHKEMMYEYIMISSVKEIEDSPLPEMYIYVSDEHIDGMPINHIIKSIQESEMGKLVRFNGSLYFEADYITIRIFPERDGVTFYKYRYPTKHGLEVFEVNESDFFGYLA